MSENTEIKSDRQPLTPRMKDLTGKKFGRLTALYPTNKRDRKGSVVWMCECTCGNRIEVTTDLLQNGIYQSCGCLKKEHQMELNKSLHRVDGTCIEWLEHRKHRVDNASGFRGVFRAKNGKYRVSIGFKKKRFYLGTFDTYEEAVQERLRAEDLIYGEFIKSWNEWNEQAEADPEWGEEHPLIFDVEMADGTLRVHRKSEYAGQSGAVSEADQCKARIIRKRRSGMRSGMA